MISPLICGCASLSIGRPRANKLYQSTASSGKECAFFGKQRPDGEPAKRTTYSMRRTKAAQIYKKTGNLRAVQPPLGHTKLESTVRYLGIEVDDALIISEQVEL